MSHKATPSITETWEAARILLNEGKQAATAQMDAAQQMHPQLLMERIDARLSGLEYALEKFIAAAVQMQDKSNQPAFVTMVEAAAVARKDMEVFDEPEMSRPEGTSEHKIAEESTVEETVTQETVHSAERIMRLKDAATQTTLTANASQPQAEAKAITEKKETTQS